MKINSGRIKHISQLALAFRNPRHWWLLLGAYRTKRNNTCPPEILRRVNSINGWLSPYEVALIHWAACAWPVAGPVIELGTFLGRSTAAFALGGRFVHCIDAWNISAADLAQHDFVRDQNGDDIYRAFLKNIQQIEMTDQIEIHRGFTNEVGRAWREPCALLFVDANHSYLNVRDDLKTWTPHLMSGGLLLMHDLISLDCPEVKLAASEILRRDWRIVARTGSLVAFTRR